MLPFKYQVGGQFKLNSFVQVNLCWSLPRNTCSSIDLTKRFAHFVCDSLRYNLNGTAKKGGYYLFSLTLDWFELTFIKEVNIIKFHR